MGASASLELESYRQCTCVARMSKWTTLWASAVRSGGSQGRVGRGQDRACRRASLYTYQCCVFCSSLQLDVLYHARTCISSSPAVIDDRFGPQDATYTEALRARPASRVTIRHPPARPTSRTSALSRSSPTKDGSTHHTCSPGSSACLLQTRIRRHGYPLAPSSELDARQSCTKKTP